MFEVIRQKGSIVKIMGEFETKSQAKLYANNLYLTEARHQNKEIARNSIEDLSTPEFIQVGYREK